MQIEAYGGIFRTDIGLCTRTVKNDDTHHEFGLTNISFKIISRSLKRKRRFLTLRSDTVWLCVQSFSRLRAILWPMRTRRFWCRQDMPRDNQHKHRTKSTCFPTQTIPFSNSCVLNLQSTPQYMRKTFQGILRELVCDGHRETFTIRNLAHLKWLAYIPCPEKHPSLAIRTDLVCIPRVEQYACLDVLIGLLVWTSKA